MHALGFSLILSLPITRRPGVPTARQVCVGAMATNSIGPERHHLARQVQAFRLHAKKLKKIFKETVKVLSDLQDFDESLSIDQILALDAQKCISNVVSGRTALVVFGDTRVKSSIVNEILGEWGEGSPRLAFSVLFLLFGGMV